VRAATGVAVVLVAGAAALAALGLADDGEEEPPAASRARSTALPPTQARADGKAVWVAQGCGSCHRLTAAGSTGDIGPDLDALRGAPASYIRTSIVDPAAASAPGFSPGAMPEDYASRISPAELDRLVAFIAGRAR
jgi:mono/diheme cytochrome c family protein